MNLLEAYLKKESSEYFSLYKNVQQAAQNIWREARLGWYTDHGVGHSSRIVDLLDQICGDLLADNQPDGLRPDEVFLLLAATWLHDIGMQDLTDLDNKSVDQQTEAEWESVRERHPQRAYDIISSYALGSSENNAFDLGLNANRDVCTLLSLVCKGHGSAYYEEVVKKRNNRIIDIEGRGKPVRGALLTSLLLLADELDLHGSRAVWKENYPLSNVSNLHYFRHHFVNHVKVVKLNAVDRQIQITLALPEDAQNSGWATDLQRWLERKLKFELNRTEEHIWTGFNGCLQWAKKKPPLLLRMELAEPHEKKLPSDEIIALLARETAHVLDWKDAAEEAQKRISKRKGGVMLIRGGSERGNKPFFNHLSLLLNCPKDNGQPLQRIVSMDLGRGDSYDSLERVTAELTQRLFGEKSSIICSSAEILAKLGEKAEELDSFCIILLKDFDQMVPQAKKEVVVALSALDAAVHERLLFIINTDEQMRGAKCFELPATFSEKDMVRYFEKHGHYGDAAESKAKQLKEMQVCGSCTAEQVIQYAKFLTQS